MSATKTLSIVTSEEVRIQAFRGKSTIYVDNPEIEEMLKEVAWDDIVSFIQSEKSSPGEIFTDDQLGDWAKKNGYIKDDGYIIDGCRAE